MPRSRRWFVEGLSQHVVQRGHNRTSMFRDDTDRSVFLLILADACQRHDARVHGYVLMDNHIHLLVTPGSKTSLPKAMQQLGCRFVPYFNRRYGRSGGLWEGRYRAHLIETQEYWLSCLRYIELNPVRAGMVATPDRYLWSSFNAHASGREDRLLGPHPLFDALGASPGERQAVYREFCGQSIRDVELEGFRYAIRTGDARRLECVSAVVPAA